MSRTWVGYAHFLWVPRVFTFTIQFQKHFQKHFPLVLNCNYMFYAIIPRIANFYSNGKNFTRALFHLAKGLFSDSSIEMRTLWKNQEEMVEIENMATGKIALMNFLVDQTAEDRSLSLKVERYNFPNWNTKRKRHEKKNQERTSKNCGRISNSPTYVYLEYWKINKE